MALNKKDKIQITVTGALVIVLVFVVGNGFRKRPAKSSPVAVPKYPQVTPPASIQAQSPATFLKLKEEARTLEFKRDPFLKQAAVSSVRGGPSLSGIAWDEEDPTAIINGRIARRGDNVDGYVVVDIKKDRVILSDGTQDLELKWVGE
jgi:hypothetical protein